MKPHKTDTELRLDGAEALIRALGEVDAEGYIALMLREPFDYTEVATHVAYSCRPRRGERSSDEADQQKARARG